MRARVVFLGAVALVFACSDLKRADDAPPGLEADAGDGSDAAVDGSTPNEPPDAAKIDAGPPPTDFECTSDAWTKTTKTKKECEPRQVKIVDPEIAIDTPDVSIARTPSGRIGIAYHFPTNADEGETHLVHFTPTTAAFTAAIIKRALGPFSQAGYAVKLGASAPDTLHMLSHDVIDVSPSDVVHLRLVAGKEPLTDPELVVNGVAPRTELGFAVDSAGNAVATVRMQTGKTDGGAPLAKIVARRKTAGGAFTMLPDVATGLLPNEAPRTGEASLIVDANGQFNLLFHYCEVFAHSQPRYHSLDGSSWSYRKTVDNAIVDGLSGYSPRIAVHDGKKYAAYYFRKALQSPPESADLRLASWSLATDTPTIEILDQSIPSLDAQYPRYRVAMAVDVFGLVHLAIVRPVTAKSGYLEYRRQTRLDGGGIKWLSDIVDPEVLSESSDAVVDMVVDDKGRPHIAYRSGVDLKVRYATRYDR